MKTTETNNRKNSGSKSVVFIYKGRETPSIIIKESPNTNMTKIESVLFGKLCQFWTPNVNLIF